MLMVYMHDCHARGLRPKTMKSYEQTLRLFGVWIADRHGIVQVEGIHAAHIRGYISDLQTRGKYTYCSRIESTPLNHPLNRRDYSKPVSLVTINGYLRNLRAFFTWAVSEEFLVKSPMQKIKLLPEERQPKEYLDDEEVLRSSFEGRNQLSAGTCSHERAEHRRLCALYVHADAAAERATDI